MFFSWLHWCTGLLEEAHRGKVPYSSAPIRGCLLATCSLSVDVFLDHLAKALFARLLCYKVSAFLLSHLYPLDIAE